MGETVWAIVVAGGSGQRFGSTKQFEMLNGRPVHELAVAGARSVAEGVVLVIPAGRETDPSIAGSADAVVPGGATRADSVRSGLEAVPAEAGIVVVHDAARPLATAALFHGVVEAVQAGADGAIPGLAITDTVKQVEDGVVRRTLDRSVLVRVQTPQAFRARILREAHAGCPEATDDAALLEALGAVVAVVPGEEGNIKITSQSDLALAEWLDRVARLDQT
jgi:2-C-methyl-D-erythritol 4-phosphate cytidylyltransferase